jgi:hypothetical protein
MTRFCLSQSLLHELFLLFHDGILAIRKPFTRTFSFLSRWNSGYQEAFHTNFFFSFTMEFWLSQSLFTYFSFLSRWNSSYHGAFSRFFLSHNGILVITELSHEFFFHTMESWLSRSLLMNFSFTRWNAQNARLGGDSFHIYHKEYLHRIHLVKNLASWFRAPFARKRVRSSLF